MPSHCVVVRGLNWTNSTWCPSEATPCTGSVTYHCEHCEFASTQLITMNTHRMTNHSATDCSPSKTQQQQQHVRPVPAAPSGNFRFTMTTLDGHKVPGVFIWQNNMVGGEGGWGWLPAEEKRKVMAWEIKRKKGGKEKQEKNCTVNRVLRLNNSGIYAVGKMQNIYPYKVPKRRVNDCSLKTQKPGNYKFKCDQCGYGWNGLALFKRHIKANHGSGKKIERRIKVVN